MATDNFQAIIQWGPDERLGMTGGWRIETRRGRRMFALGWLLVLHVLADVTVAVYRCAAVNPPLTDLLAGGLMRAQFGLLCVWLLAGKDPLSWRLAGLLSGASFLFLIYSRLLFAGYYKPTLGPAWFQYEFNLYFRSTGPGDLLLKAPLIFAGLAIALPVYRYVLWLARRCDWLPDERKSARQEQSGSRLRWLQFSVADFLIWSFTLGFVLMALSVTPHYEGWLELIRWRWSLGWQGKLPDSALLLTAAWPTAAMVLLGCWQGQHWNGHLRRLAIVGIVGLFVGIAVEAWWQAVHPERPHRHTALGGLRCSEALLMPLVGCLSALTVWLLALYDRPAKAKLSLPLVLQSEASRHLLARAANSPSPLRVLLPPE